MRNDKQTDGMVSMTEDVMHLDAEALAAKRRRRSRWKKIVGVMACIVVFCTTYALILPAITLGKDDTVLECPVSVHQHEAGCYGDDGSLICGQADYVIHTHDESCYDADGNLVCRLPEIKVHEHDESCYDAEGNLTCDKEEIIAHTHDESCYDADGSLICGKLEVVEHIHGDGCFREASDNHAAAADETAVVEDTVGESERSYTCEGDSYVVKVTLPENSAVPVNAILRVHSITDIDESYETLMRQAGEAVNGTAKEVLLYDISFYTSEEEYIPVEDTATVSFTFKESVLTQGNGNVAVLHYEEGADAPVALHEVDVARDENDALAGVTFQTEGFSVFALVNVSDESGIAAQTEEDTDNLDGRSFAIVNQYNGTCYALTSDSVTVNGVGGLDAQTVEMEQGDDGTYRVSGSATEWTFLRQSDGTYYITTTVTENGAEKPQYLYLCKNSYDTSNDGRGSLTLSDTAQAINVTVRDDGTVMLIYGSSYVNLDLGAFDFWCYNQEPTNGSSYFYLCEVVEESFKITYGNNVLTVNLVDQNGNSLPKELLEKITLEDITAESGDTYYFKDIISNIPIEGYIYREAKLVEKENVTVEWVNGDNYNGTDQFRFYKAAATYWTINGQSTVNLVFVQDNSIIYNINVPSMSSKGTGWAEAKTPVLSGSATQIVGEAGGTLYAQPEGYYAETGPAGLSNLYRFNVTVIDSLESSEAWKQGFSEEWFGEERFDGWTYTTDGTTYLFDPEAEIDRDSNRDMIVRASKTITTDDDGNDVITKITETEVVLPAGAVLTGHWTEVSNVATFFVNYKGTILDTEGDVSGRRSDTFTKTVAIGHVFYGKQKVGADQTFGAEANAEITAAFRAGFDPDDPDTQIVISYLRTMTRAATSDMTYDTDMNLSSPGANSKVIEANTLKLLKDTGRTIQVATSTAGTGNNPVIDSSLCDTDHYEMRWYVMKEQTDTWHIDGVLVAKTAEMAVTKTFTGLDTTQVAKLLGEETDENKTDDFQIDVKLGEGKQNYLTITNKEIPGQYEYTGTEGSLNLPNSYHWIFHAITGEQYTMEESNYELEGYDVSCIVVHYYKDEKTGADKIVYTYGGSTGDFEDEQDRTLIGGNTTAISFNNFYTPAGTGAMAIVKRDKNSGENDVYGKLSDAEFTLYSDANCTTEVQRAVSNGNGTAYFDNLGVGTYYLKETKAPDGYANNDGMWIVEVTKKETDSNIVVTLYEQQNGIKYGAGQVLYDDGIKGSYTIKDTANTSTVTVTKTFSGIALSQLDEMVAKSNKDNGNECFYIDLQGNISGSGTIDADGKTNAALYLSDAQRSQDGMTFIWTVHDLAVAAATEEGGSEPINYTLSENNFLNENYVDTAVSVKLNGKGQNVDLDRKENLALVSQITFQTDDSDSIVITNHYTNTFDLRLKKVDSKTGDVLPNAVFYIYGPYAESTDPSNKVTYTDEDGKQNTYYYISEITSDANGIATQTGLHLSQGKNTFMYILKEIKAPDTYAELEEPLVATVTVDTEITTDTGTYEGGELSIEAENTKEREVVLTLKTKKLWEPSAPSNPTVTLQLYRVTHAERNVPLDKGVNAVLVKEITLDGVVDKEPEKPPDNTPEDSSATIPEPDVYESEPWVATWINIPSANTKSTNSDEHYHYFVREVTQMDGYTTSYKCYRINGSQQEDVTSEEGVFQTLTVVDENGEPMKDENGKTMIVEAVLMADMAEDYTVEITNTEYYELPETGGSGILKFTIGGLLLTAGSLWYGYRLRRSRKEVKM